jgi:hypothetical protein
MMINDPSQSSRGKMSCKEAYQLVEKNHPKAMGFGEGQRGSTRLIAAH